MNMPTTSTSAASPNYSSNKSKKSKSDIIRSAVGLFLKQKCFVGNEKYRKSDFQLLQNKKQFAVQKMLENDTNNINSFTYSNVLCITNNPHLVEQQFGKFTQFIEDQDETVRQEMRRLYAPMMCHLYMELLKAREPKLALDFLRKYAYLVAPIDIYDTPMPSKLNGGIDAVNGDNNEQTSQQANIRFLHEASDADDSELDYFVRLITTLSSYTKLDLAENDPLIAHFRATKYDIQTTESMMKILKTYLQKRGHVLILNIIYTWLRFHVIDNELQQWTEDYLFLQADAHRDEDTYEFKFKDKVSNKRTAEESLDTLIKQENAGLTDEKQQTANNVQNCLLTLQKTKEQIQKSQSVFPRFIKIADKGRSLTSADLDVKECHLLAGFNNSIVQLWQLNQQTQMGKNLYRSITKRTCYWDVNNCYAEEMDEIMNDIEWHEQQLSNNTSRLNEKFNAHKYEDNSYNEFGGIQLRGHGLGVTAVRFSKRHPLIYSVSKDTTIRAWSARNFSCASIYRGHRYPIWCFDENPAGSYLVTGSKDFTARLWSVERQAPLFTYVGHTQDVECIAFHPNGNYIATGSVDMSVRLWCITSGKLMRVFSDCKQPVSALAFSPDGKMLAVGGEESKVRIFDVAAVSQLNELKEHTANVCDLTWSANSKQLATVCRDGTFRLWDVKRLLPMSETNSSSSSSSLNRLLALNSNCQSLSRIIYTRNETFCCIGC